MRRKGDNIPGRRFFCRCECGCVFFFFWAQANNSILNRNDRNLINTRICFARLPRSSDQAILDSRRLILDSRSRDQTRIRTRSNCGFSRNTGMQLSLGLAISKHFVVARTSFTYAVRSQFLSCVFVCIGKLKITDLICLTNCRQTHTRCRQTDRQPSYWDLIKRPHNKFTHRPKTQW